jgi:hypothetical protein
MKEILHQVFIAIYSPFNKVTERFEFVEDCKRKDPHLPLLFLKIQPPTETELTWYYLDQIHQAQGPFSSSQLRIWWKYNKTPFQSFDFKHTNSSLFQEFFHFSRSFVGFHI